MTGVPGSNERLSVSTSARVSRARSVPGAALIARAVVLLIAAAVITFSQDHNAVFAHIVFGAASVVQGVVLALGARTRPAGEIERRTDATLAPVSLVFGIAALALLDTGNLSLQILIVLWGLFQGAIELVAGIRVSRRVGRREGADLVLAGVLGLLLAGLCAFVSPNLSQTYSGPDNVGRLLTAPIVLLGFYGGYTAILGVFLGIAGFGQRHGDDRKGDLA
jgi:uncharacterized membrane protein HdeD (DUF308 family)